MNIIIKRNKVRRKFILKTQTNETLEGSHMRSSLGEEAKQHLRQISQLSYINNDIVKDIDWSSFIQERSLRNFEKSKGCFEINLTQLRVKPITVNNQRFCRYEEDDKQVNKLPAFQTNKLSQLNKTRKKKSTCGSLNYIIGDHRSKQSRIHSLNSVSTKNTCSHFMVNEDAFKEAALKFQSYFQKRSPEGSEKNQNSRIQSSLVVHKRRIETISTNEKYPRTQYKMTKRIFASPKKINYQIPLVDSKFPVQKLRINVALKGALISNPKGNINTL